MCKAHWCVNHILQCVRVVPSSCEAVCSAAALTIKSSIMDCKMATGATEASTLCVRGEKRGSKQSYAWFTLTQQTAKHFLNQYFFLWSSEIRISLIQDCIRECLECLFFLIYFSYPAGFLFISLSLSSINLTKFKKNNKKVLPVGKLYKALFGENKSYCYKMW